MNMENKKTVPLKSELSGTAKSFYEENDLLEICDWLETFINFAASNGKGLSEIITAYENGKVLDATIIGGIQKIIDAIRAAENEKENRKE